MCVWNRGDGEGVGCFFLVIFYYEKQIKSEIMGIHICGCRCNERVNAKTDGSTDLAYTGLRVNWNTLR